MPLLLCLPTSGRLPVRLCQACAGQLWRLQTRQQMVWVALAEPINFVQAVAWGVVLITMVGMGVDERFFIEMARMPVCRSIWSCGVQPVPAAAVGRRARILVGLLPGSSRTWCHSIKPGRFHRDGVGHRGWSAVCGCVR